MIWLYNLDKIINFSELSRDNKKGADATQL